MRLGSGAVRELRETVRRVLSAPTTRSHERPESRPQARSGSDLVAVLNVGLQEIPVGGVVAADGFSWPAGEGPVWKVRRPTKDFARVHLIAEREPIAKNRRGLARFALGDPAWALAESPDGRLDAGANAGLLPGEAWGVAADSFALRPRRPGFTGLGAVKAQGSTRFVAIEQSPPETWIGKPKQAIAVGESGEVALWDAGEPETNGRPKLSPTPLGLSVTGYVLAEDVTADKWTAVNWVAGRWLVTPLECG